MLRYPICIYENTALTPAVNDVDHNGLGILTPSACTVTETCAGEFSLEMTHPMDNDYSRWTLLRPDRIIGVYMPLPPLDDSVDPTWTNQLKRTFFRITEVTCSSSTGLITVKALHVSYDLNNYYTQRYIKISGKETDLSTLEDAKIKTILKTNTLYAGVAKLSSMPVRLNLDNLKDDTLYTGDLHFKSGIQLLLDPEEGIAAKCGLRVIRNNRSIWLYSKQAGPDRGYTVEYGKNMKGLTWTKDASNVVTRIYAYKEISSEEEDEDEDGNRPVAISSKTYPNSTTKYYNKNGNAWKSGKKYRKTVDGCVDSPYIGNFAVPRTAMVEGPESIANYDTDDWNEKRAAFDKALWKAATEQFEAGCDEITLTLEVEFQFLGDTAEYREKYANLEKVWLYDTVRVEAAPYGCSTTLHVSEIIWDCVNMRYSYIKLGPLSSGETATVQSYELADGSVSGMKIASGAVAATNLSSLCVTTAKIGTAAVTSAKIEDAAITSAKIQDAAITNAKIGDAEIDSAKLGDVTAKVASITEATIKSADISSANIAELYAGIAETVRSHITELRAGTVTAETFASEVITASEAFFERGGFDEATVGQLKGTLLDYVNAHMDSLSADYVTSTLISADVARVGTAFIDIGVIKSLSGDSAMFDTVTASGKITCPELLVEAANIDVLNVGRLILRDEDGNMKQLTVSTDEDGNTSVSAVETNVTGDDIAEASVPLSKLAVKELSASDVTAVNLLAGNITASTLLSALVKAGVVGTDLVEDQNGTLTLKGGSEIRLITGDLTNMTGLLKYADGVVTLVNPQAASASMQLASDGITITDANGQKAAAFKDRGMTTDYARTEYIRIGKLSRKAVSPSLVVDYWEVTE